ncbi:hypothetical protein CTRI78_v001741 [Colletotrichum trifolii]|uniref:Secreted protein n=1 Tax=Colletotrichum trifolii TaxID=5466 RepID=A0A4V3HX63_COLTR|nr:hypothetical protein CTRI78_v001741 [Colletotrichum trifolii]
MQEVLPLASLVAINIIPHLHTTAVQCAARVTLRHPRIDGCAHHIAHGRFPEEARLYCCETLALCYSKTWRTARPAASGRLQLPCIKQGRSCKEAGRHLGNLKFRYQATCDGSSFDNGFFGVVVFLGYATRHTVALTLSQTER